MRVVSFSIRRPIFQALLGYKNRLITEDFWMSEDNCLERVLLKPHFDEYRITLRRRITPWGAPCGTRTICKPRSPLFGKWSGWSRIPQRRSSISASLAMPRGPTMTRIQPRGRLSGSMRQIIISITTWVPPIISWANWRKRSIATKLPCN